jgi:acetyltransferase-like isoleucine patch superfamily enzyme
MTINKFFKGIGKMAKKTIKYWMLKYCMYSFLLYPLNSTIIRPRLWRLIGCKVGKKVYIGYDVAIDVINSNYIELEDNVTITNHVLLLCHLRNLADYYIGDDYSALGYRYGKIHIKEGATVGMKAIILPGVTIGRGAIVGAGSLVTKDVPDWAIAAGNPAKVIKMLEERPNNDQEV